MKNSKFLVIIYILTIMFALIGTTFSYFTQKKQSNDGAILAKSTVIGVNLNLEPLYTEKELIPMNDEDVMKAYENKCIDINEYGACQAYTITVENIGESLEYEGTVNFNTNNIANLKFLLLDENDEIYQDITSINAGTDHPLGSKFNLQKEENKTFKLIVWLSNLEYDQFEYDGNGNFDATVTYQATGNYHVTGSISGN